LIIKPFSFLKNYSDRNSDQQLGKFGKYRAPRLYKGARWWIEYQFRVPPCVRHLHKNKTWEKFRVFEDINRYKTDEYAQLLLTAISFALKEGFDPFEHEKQLQEQIQQEVAPASVKDKVWTITQGLNYFLQKWQKRDNEESTLRRYKHPIELLTQWLTVRKMQNQPLDILTDEHIEAFLEEGKERYEWSKRTYNNHKGFLQTIFKFLVDKGIMKSNPCIGVALKKTKSQKHKYYDQKRLETIRELLKKHDPVLFLAARLVYYLCIRSDKELKYFKVGNIFLDRKQVLVRADDSKTDSDRYIPISDEILPDLQYLVKNYPPEYYVIGPGSRNKFVRNNTPGKIPFGRNFLSARFAKIRQLAGFSSDYTLYGFKHTRIVHLKRDGGKDTDIMQLTGHTTYEAYSTYLRDLGMEGDPDAINQISRKF
jgi:integrase